MKKPVEFWWYKRNPTAALAGMRGLNPEQKGIYGVLIELCYEKRGPLPDDDKTNARACDCDIRQYRRVRAELIAMDRIKVDERLGIIWDDRAIRVLTENGMFSETQARRAQTRWAKTNGVVDFEAERSARARGLAKPQLGPQLSPKSEGFSNEINAPPHASREEQSRKREIPKKRATRAAQPPGGGGAPGHGMSIEEWRRDQLSRCGLQASKGKDGAEGEAGPEPKRPKSKAADKTAKRESA